MKRGHLIIGKTNLYLLMVLVLSFWTTKAYSSNFSDVCSARQILHCNNAFSVSANFSEIVVGSVPTDAKFFNSTVDKKWSTPGNWSNGTLPTATDNVFIDGDCELDCDATVASLSVLAGKSITILKDKILNVTDAITTTEVNQLVIEDGGQLVHDNAGVLATVQKNISRSPGVENGHWYLIASPVIDNDSVENLTVNDYGFYSFDQSGNPKWIEQSEDVAVEYKKGYLYATVEEVTLAFKGTLAAVAEPTPLEYEEDAEFAGFNLVGNPYPCNAYVGNSFYRMNADGNSLIAETGVISPCESVFIEATADGQYAEFGKTAMAPELIKVSLADGNGALIDQALVRFDGKADLHKMLFDGECTRIYVHQNDDNLASFSTSLEQGSLPLHFKTIENGNYTLSFSVENMEIKYLHLVDNITGADVNVMAGQSTYSFSASTADYASRFKLMFNLTGVEENDASISSEGFAYMSEGNLIIDNIKGEAKLQIMDMTGRIVISENVKDSYNKALNLRAGIYVVRMKGMSQKIVVK